MTTSTTKSCSATITLQQPHGMITTRCVPGWHRRPLPDVAIPFNSDRGKRIFREALLADGLNGYFSLAETFHTQSEPSYCGPGTLSMVLNSLNIDPGQIWKGNWRFFDEYTLRTCDKRKPKETPLLNVIEQGLTFEEFLFLTECNGGSIIPFPFSHTSLAQFRSAILVACTRHSDDIRLVCSYDRRTLQQTGTGHFSPIAGYHIQEDLVLILDVARFKYPSYWISVELLWQSMSMIDPTTEKPRGFYLIAKWPTDISIECNTNNCQNTNDQLAIDSGRLSSSVEEDLSSFIEIVLSPMMNSIDTIESMIISILQSFSFVVVQLLTKWTFDLLQKYRLAAVSSSECCQEQCSCINQFQSYPSFLPDIIDSSLTDNTLIGCQKPCARVTRSHVHAYVMPMQCTLDSFVHLFDNETNRQLYQILEQMQVEQYLIITKDKPVYLFGALSLITENRDTMVRTERGLTAILLYALRTSTFLSNIELLDSSELSNELKDEIKYARVHLGL